MKIALSLGSLYGFPLRGVLKLVRETGFEGIELLITPEVMLRGPRTVRALVEDQGLAVHVVHRGLVPLPGWTERGTGIGRMVDLAAEVGAPTVVVHPPRGVGSFSDPVASRFTEKVDAAAAAGGDRVTIAIENLSLKSEADRKNPFNDLPTLRRYAEDHGLGMTLDTSHAASWGHDLLAAFAPFRGRLHNLHLSDFQPRTGWRALDALNNHFVQHQAPGHGVLPLQALLETMAAENYDGNVSLEVGPIPTRAWWRPALRRNLAAMSRYVREARKRGQASPR